MEKKKDPLEIGREELGFPPGQDPEFIPSQLKTMRFVVRARQAQLKRQLKRAKSDTTLPPYAEFEINRKLTRVKAALRVLRRNRPPSQ